MGGIDRRGFLKITGATLGAAAAGTPIAAQAQEKTADWGKSFAMLNDCVKCVGCRACQSACKSYHHLEKTGDDPLYDYPLDLNARNLTLIKLYRDKDKFSFIKRQCNHCIRPSCVSVCPVGALQKQPNGIVSYNKDKCIGCRYCQIGCTYQVPTFEYDKALPVIQKCDFCREKTENGGIPECASVCPAGAIKFGTRDEMIALAKKRIKENPDKYIDHVYGENEIGGISVLYLSGVPFEKLGLPKFGPKPFPEMPEKIQHGIFKYFIPPALVFAFLGITSIATRKQTNGKEK